MSNIREHYRQMEKHYYKYTELANDLKDIINDFADEIIITDILHQICDSFVFVWKNKEKDTHNTVIDINKLVKVRNKKQLIEYLENYEV